jgi:hypothetical protein
MAVRLSGKGPDRLLLRISLRGLKGRRGAEPAAGHGSRQQATRLVLGCRPDAALVWQATRPISRLLTCMTAPAWLPTPWVWGR